MNKANKENWEVTSSDLLEVTVVALNRLLESNQQLIELNKELAQDGVIWVHAVPVNDESNSVSEQIWFDGMM